MNPVHALVNEQAALLQSMGYIGSPGHTREEQDKLIEQFRARVLSHLLRVPAGNRPDNIVVNFQGFFNSRKDVVDFTLLYRYEPAVAALRFTAMAARMGPLKKVFLPPAPARLLDAAMVYKMLAATRAQHQERRMSSAKMLVRHIPFPPNQRIPRL